MICFRDLGAEDVFVSCGSLLLNLWVCGQAGALLFYRRAVSLKKGILFSWRAKWSLCFCEVLGRNGPRFMVENFGFRDASAWLPHGFRENPLTLLVWCKSFHPAVKPIQIDYGLWTKSQIITCIIHSYIYLSYSYVNLSLYDLCIWIYIYIYISYIYIYINI